MAGLLGGDDFFGGDLGLLGASMMAGTSPFAGVNIGNAFLSMPKTKEELLKLQMAQRAAKQQQALDDAAQRNFGGGQRNYQGYLNDALAADPMKAAAAYPALSGLRTQDLLAGMQGAQSQAPQAQAPQMPQSAPSQNFAGANPDYQPIPGVTKGAAIGVPAAPAGPGPDGTANTKSSIFNQFSTVADNLARAGDMEGSLKYRQLAQQYRPQLKDTKTLTLNGQRVTVNLYTDGTQEVLPFGPDKEKAVMVDAGNKVIPSDAFTGAQIGAPIGKSMTPGEAASNAIAATRLRFDTGMSPGGFGGVGSGGVAGGVAPPAPAGTPNALPPAAQVELAKKQGGGLIDNGVKYKDSLDSNVSAGSDLMYRIAESKKMLDLFQPGMGAGAREQVARFAAAMGAPDSLVNRLNAGDLSAKQVFEKLAAQQAMESLKQAMGSGRITQSEFKVFLDNNPKIAMERGAINHIFDTIAGIHAKNMAEQRGLINYIHQGGNVSDWPSIWAQMQAQDGYQLPQMPKASGGFKVLGKE